MEKAVRHSAMDFFARLDTDWLQDHTVPTGSCNSLKVDFQAWKIHEETCWLRILEFAVLNQSDLSESF